MTKWIKTNIEFLTGIFIGFLLVIIFQYFHSAASIQTLEQKPEPKIKPLQVTNQPPVLPNQPEPELLPEQKVEQTTQTSNLLHGYELLKNQNGWYTFKDPDGRIFSISSPSKESIIRIANMDYASRKKNKQPEVWKVVEKGK